MPSFSTKTKTDVSKVKIKSDQGRKCELTAFVWYAGSISLTRDGMRLVLTTAIEPVAQRILSIIGHLYQYECIVQRVQKEQLKKTVKTLIIVTGDTARQILADCGIIRKEDEDTVMLNETIRFDEKDQNSIDSFLRGMFLACGTLYPPEKGYHLEFVMDDLERANESCRILYEMGWNVHLSHRRDKEIVYIKEYDSIAQFLAHIGAYSAYLRMEEERMMRDINNDVNRGSNCNNANIVKLVDASQKQIRAIEFLEREGILRQQSLSLRRTAEMRLDYPEASLEELADLLNITKSGANHRLRKLVSLAAENQSVD